MTAATAGKLDAIDALERVGCRDQADKLRGYGQSSANEDADDKTEQSTAG
jgi:hypothetical protein